MEVSPALERFIAAKHRVWRMARRHTVLGLRGWKENNRFLRAAVMARGTLRREYRPEWLVDGAESSCHMVSFWTGLCPFDDVYDGYNG